ncbi:MAG: type II toxin-antitoxin system RelE/ParE family toxin [Alkalispirochaeta sp.]
MRRKVFGSSIELWRYRVGNYRIVCSIEDKTIEVVVVRVGHRNEVYHKKS